MKHTIIVCVCLLTLLFVGSTHADTLFEATWNDGTVRSGAWTSGGERSAPGPTDCWDVLTGGYNGDNYLRIIAPDTSSDWIYGHTSFSNPSTLYVRFYMRFNADFPNWIYHPIVMGSSPQPASQYFCRFAPGNSGLTWSYNNYRRWTSSITDGTWYRMEYKFTQGAGATDSLEIRIDGVDVTDSYCLEGSTCLDEDNGSLSFPELNYIAFETYDNPAGFDVVDISNLKITDGPTWIGGLSETDTTPPELTSQVLGTNGQTLTLGFDEAVEFGAGANDSDWTLTPSGGAATLTYSSGAESTSLVYTTSRVIYSTETLTVSYTQPGNGVEDSSGNDLATISPAVSVTNYSAIPPPGSPTIQGCSITGGNMP